jgi:hypothetical protein
MIFLTAATNTHQAALRHCRARNARWHGGDLRLVRL